MGKQLLKWIGRMVVFILLTVISQVGGVIYLLCLPFFKKLKASSHRIALFVVVYSICSLLVVPALAPNFGRVALPLSKTGDLRPHTWWTCWLNRHYVTPKVKTSMARVIKKFQAEFPDQQVTYLDANFPFWNGFPLLPHLSHDDGKKLDLAFIYKNKKTKSVLKGGARSLLGYGVCEIPRKGEKNQPAICKKQGRWMYNFTRKLALRGHPTSVEADAWRTGRLIGYIAKDPGFRRLFLEPHLVDRWQLRGYSKIVFHGCHAVRHDDHMHIEE